MRSRSVDSPAAFVKSAEPGVAGPSALFHRHDHIALHVSFLCGDEDNYDGDCFATSSLPLGWANESNILNGYSVQLENLLDASKSGYSLVFCRLSVAATFPKLTSTVLMQLQDPVFCPL